MTTILLIPISILGALWVFYKIYLVLKTGKYADNYGQGDKKTSPINYWFAIITYLVLALSMVCGFFLLLPEAIKIWSGS
jgi:hypothetical protein